MPLDWAKLKLINPKFDDRQVFLKTCGGYVVKEIIDMIGREQRPDGSPQKQNSDAYKAQKKLRKGYTKPLWGMEGAALNIKWGQRQQKKGPTKLGSSSGIISPYLARPKGSSPYGAAWLIDFEPPDTAVVHLNKKREEIGIKLQEMGYWFMGITRTAKKQIQKSADQYVKLKFNQMRGMGFGK